MKLLDGRSQTRSQILMKVRYLHGYLVSDPLAVSHDRMTRAHAKKRVAVNTKKMSSQPSTGADLMAVEPSNENKDAAAPQDPAPGAMLTDEDLESPTKKRKVCTSV